MSKSIILFVLCFVSLNAFAEYQDPIDTCSDATSTLFLSGLINSNYVQTPNEKYHEGIVALKHSADQKDPQEVTLLNLTLLSQYEDGVSSPVRMFRVEYAEITPEDYKAKSSQSETFIPDTQFSYVICQIDNPIIYIDDKNDQELLEDFFEESIESTEESLNSPGIWDEDASVEPQSTTESRKKIDGTPIRIIRVKPQD